MADYGIKISKPGIDVGTGAVQNMVLHSEANCLKIVGTGSVAFTAAGTANTLGTITHSLGFTPFFFTYFELKHSGRVYFQDSNDVSLHPTNFTTGLAEARGTNELVFTISNDGAGFNGTIHYILLGNRAYT